MNDKSGQRGKSSRVKVGAIWFMLLIGLWMFLPHYALGTSGVQIVLQPQGIDKMTPAQRDDTINRIISVLTSRVAQYGMANAEVKLMWPDQVLVNLPETADPAQTRQLISETGILWFMKVVQTGTNPDDNLVPASPNQEVLKNRNGVPYIVDRQPFLTGAALSNAEVRTSQWIQNAGQLFIALTLNPRGAQRFVNALWQLKVGDRLAIVLDNVIYSTPLITQAIKNAATRGWRAVQNSIIIQGPFTSDEAMRIAVVLRTGALPVPVSVVRESPL